MAARTSSRTVTPVPATKLLLIDFDETLTREHTGGALNLLRHCRCLYRKPDGTVLPLHENVAGGDSRFVYNLIYEWVVTRGRHLGIVTFANNDVVEKVRRQLPTDELRRKYQTLGGEALVQRWLWCVALAACQNDVIAATESVANLFRTGRFAIEAFMPQPSQHESIDGRKLPVKRDHVARILRRFTHEGPTPIAHAEFSPENVLYIDNTEYLLRDIAETYQGVRVFWTRNFGLSSRVWDEMKTVYPDLGFNGQ